MGDHPIAWYHEYDGGRAWYTGRGHEGSAYEEPLFKQHLLGGMLYAAALPTATACRTSAAPARMPVLESALVRGDRSVEIVLTGGGEHVVELLDLQGRKVYARHELGREGRCECIISARGMSAGTYLLRTRRHDGATQVRTVLLR
jgi:hypothetical protein